MGVETQSQSILTRRGPAKPVAKNGRELAHRTGGFRAQLEKYPPTHALQRHIPGKSMPFLFLHQLFYVW
jgi:hypothetical protein